MSDLLTGIGAVTAPLATTGAGAARAHPSPSAEPRPPSTPSPANQRSETLQALNARPANRSESGQGIGQAPTEEAGRETNQGVRADDKEMVERLSEAVDKINEMLEGRQMLTFQLDEESGRMVIRVIDAKTNEVIRQIPSEETLNFAKYVDGLIGLIFNKKA